MQNFKQTDSRWSSYPYAGETMAAAGCGATAVADLLDKSPVEIANWMSNHGYASNGSGTYQSGITACIKAYGYDCKQLTSSSRAGLMTDSSFDAIQKSVQNGNCSIFLMGGEMTGCRNSYWSRAGHFIAIVGYKDGKYLVYDPAYAARDGWHQWNDFAGNIKHVYETNIRLGDKMSSGKGSGTTSTDYTVTVKQIKYGSQGVHVLLLQEILKARGYYKGGLDRSFGKQTETAVKAYQKDRKLTVDGICGKKTWNDLLGF